MELILQGIVTLRVILAFDISIIFPDLSFILESNTYISSVPNFNVSFIILFSVLLTLVSLYKHIFLYSSSLLLIILFFPVLPFVLTSVIVPLFVILLLDSEL